MWVPTLGTVTTYLVLLGTHPIGTVHTVPATGTTYGVVPTPPVFEARMQGI